MQRLSHISFVLATAFVAFPAHAGDCPSVPVIEYERDAAGWLADAPGAVALAFDEVFPGVQPGGGCLVDGSNVVVSLPGGTVTVSGGPAPGEPGDSDCCSQNGTPGCNDPGCEAVVCAFDPFCCDTQWDAICANGAAAFCVACGAYCPVRDGSSTFAVSDASLLEDATLTFEFDPPVGTFHTYWASLPQGTTASMALYAGNDLVETLISAPSPQNGQATGHGFVSSTLISRVEFTTAAQGDTIVGAFGSLAPGDTPLGTVEIPGYAGPNGSTVNLDFACVFGHITRVTNVTQGSDHPSICDAIAAAVGGDELVVLPGVHFEAVDFEGKAITLRSTDPTDPAVVATTIIDGTGLSASVVSCDTGEGPDTVLAGLTIRNGSGTPHAGETLGGGMFNVNAGPTVVACRFVSSSADLGGGMYNQNATPIVDGCTFESNNAIFGGGGMYNNGASPTVTGCSFTGNSLETGAGAGMLNVDGSDPVVTTCVFQSNGAGADAGGGMANDASSPTVTDCMFVGNFAFERGGGMANENGSGPVVAGCTFDANGAGSGNGDGGGVHSQDSSPTVVNCVFTGNVGGSGGGLANAGSTVEVTNCSFGGNVAFDGGGSIANDLSIVAIDNCILWGSDAASEISVTASTTDVTYSIVQGGWAGPGNTSANPMFADLGAGDLHLLPGSPAIDAGDNLAPGIVGVTTDRDGLGRFQDDVDAPDCPQAPGTCGDAPIVDIGAFEIPGQCPADVDGDGAVGVTDLVAVILAWGSTDPAADVDGDGIVGVTDLVAVILAWGDC